MGLKEYAAMIAAGGSLVFGWIGAQEQLCDMRLARPICMAAPTASNAPPPAETTPASAPASEAAAPAPTTAAAASAPAPPPAIVEEAAPAPAPNMAPMQPTVLPPQIPETRPADDVVHQANISQEQARELEQMIRNYLDQSARQNGGGFRASSFGDLIDALQPNTDRAWQVRLRSGVPYRVIGACDNDCSAIRLEVYDASGALVTRSSDTSDFPVVDLRPDRSAQHTVRLRLVRCTVAPCYVGVRVLEQR
jgi:hypothetical protein